MFKKNYEIVLVHDECYEEVISKRCSSKEWNSIVENYKKDHEVWEMNKKIMVFVESL